MANRYVKKPLVNREMQIRTTMSNEMPFHTFWNGYYKKMITNVGKDVEQKMPLCTVGGNIYWCTMKNSMEVAEKIKIITTICYISFTSVCITKDNSHYLKEIYALSCLLWYYSQYPS